MITDIDSYLASDDALRETESAQGRLLHPGETFGGFRVVAFLGRGAGFRPPRRRTPRALALRRQAAARLGLVHHARDKLLARIALQIRKGDETRARHRPRDREGSARRRRTGGSRDHAGCRENDIASRPSADMRR